MRTHRWAAVLVAAIAAPALAQSTAASSADQPYMRPESPATQPAPAAQPTPPAAPAPQPPVAAPPPAGTQPSTAQPLPANPYAPPPPSAYAPPPPAQAPQPGASGGAAGSSQQVVVNPPPATGQPTVPSPSAPSNVTVNPPPAPPPAPQPVAVGAYSADTGSGDVAVQRERRSPMATVATNALYGGLAGVVIGGGIALINEGDDWGRDLMLGAGLGVLAGAVVGGVQAYRAESRDDRPRAAMSRDGLGTVAIDRARARPMTNLGYVGFRW
jgi:hypothetical protein